MDQSERAKNTSYSLFTGLVYMYANGGYLAFVPSLKPWQIHHTQLLLVLYQSSTFFSVSNWWPSCNSFWQSWRVETIGVIRSNFCRNQLTNIHKMTIHFVCFFWRIEMIGEHCSFQLLKQLLKTHTITIHFVCLENEKWSKCYLF